MSNGGYILLRSSIEDDLPSIIRVWKDNIEAKITPIEIVHAYKMNSEYWFVVDESEITGFVAGTVKTTECGHISGIAVIKDRRDKGIGRDLLSAAENSFILNSFNKMTLEVRISNTVAQRFFEKQSFERTHVIKEYYPDGEDALSYEKYF